MGSSGLEYLKAALLATEPANCVISLAKQSGGGSITTEIQTFILEHCINNFGGEGIQCNYTYIENILKKVIVAVESTCEVVVEGLYEQLAYCMTLHKKDDLLEEKSRIYKMISFFSTTGLDDISSSSVNFVASLQCSPNMLEGDTGCALWPSSLFLSEFILSYPKTFSNKSCFELGSGVGLVGISLAHVGASKVILTDGDTSSLANMKINLELNQLISGANLSQTYYSHDMVECKHLPWESASESELQVYQPDVILGADVAYDPRCMPHLVRVLSMLLGGKRTRSLEAKASGSCNDLLTHHGEESTDNISCSAKEASIAYVATVIRNKETFNYFLKLAEDFHLSVVEITEMQPPHNLLPYMLSYDRSSVRLYRITSSCS